jgi:hypothetical protein
MYGHLDYDLSVAAGDAVEPGQLLGTVLFRTDSRSPSHLHFELRTFFTTPEVNGATPRYSYPCGVQCPPGPGYWPMGDPDHPSTLGWLNPMHVIASRSYPDGVPSGTMAIVASDLMTHTTPIWSEPIERAEPLDQMILIPGQQFPLIAISVGDEASVETSANAYQVWYEIEGPDEVRGWVRAMQPSAETTQVDGRPAAVRIDFLVGTSQD